MIYEYLLWHRVHLTKITLYLLRKQGELNAVDCTVVNWCHGANLMDIECSIAVTLSLHICVCALFLFIKWLSLRKQCATSRNVVGWIPDSVIEFFYWFNGPGVDSSSNRDEYKQHFLGHKAAVCVRLTILNLMCRLSRYLGDSIYCNPQGQN
jgi:hypothetical protein